MSSFGRAIFAIGVGNALEWFDFAIFGALAEIIGFHFFPADHPNTELMSSFALYGTAFLMRPLGGIFMGYIGDTYGRKCALELSVSLMVIPSFLMGSLPTFQKIGYSATVLLVLLRMLQGLAVGGEMIGAYIYCIEACEKESRGFWGGVCKATALGGTVLGMGFVTVMREVLTHDQMYSWGWRVPFLSSLLLGILGLYFRSNLHESESYVAMKREIDNMKMKGIADSTGKKWAASEVLRNYGPEITMCICITSYWAAGYYTCFIWMGYYMSDLVMGEPIGHAWVLNICMIALLVCMMPLGGYLGDVMSRKVKSENGSPEVLGYRRIMIAGSLVMILLGIPAFYLINMRTLWSSALGQLIFAASLSLYGSCLPVVLVMQFPTKHRYTAVGIAYNISNAIFAGSAPLIQTALVVYTRHKQEKNLLFQTAIPAVYLMGVGLVACITLTFGPSLISAIRSKVGKKGSSGTMSAESIELGKSGMDSSTSSVASSALDTSSSPMIK